MTCSVDAIRIPSNFLAIWINHLMSTRELTLSVPESLAQEAESAGVLRPEVLEKLLREEVCRLKIENLFSLADRLADQEIVPLTPEEVEAEIQAARSGRHASSSNGG